MKIIYNRILPLPGFQAMMFFGVIFARPQHRPLSQHVINHEAIHHAQARECGGYMRFYFRYLAQWLRHGYKNMPFETEAYANMFEPNYLNTREPFAWKNYL